MADHESTASSQEKAQEKLRSIKSLHVVNSFFSSLKRNVLRTGLPPCWRPPDYSILIAFTGFSLAAFIDW
jgi:hypothetical protein